MTTAERPDDGPTDAAWHHVAGGVDLPGYLGGRLPIGDQRAVEDHLRACADCTAAVTSLRAVDLLLSFAAEPDRHG
ncbi:MAG TPA: zf-HC2 domain-containing protein [Acidimicrobiales bacterium]|jgi:anti-sigma factor RsiW|nr:zf-HC2 domain-containing protein [Acidimicrobiales bacterium]